MRNVVTVCDGRITLFGHLLMKSLSNPLTIWSRTTNVWHFIFHELYPDKNDKIHKLEIKHNNLGAYT